MGSNLALRSKWLDLGKLFTVRMSVLAKRLKHWANSNMVKVLKQLSNWLPWVNKDIRKGQMRLSSWLDLALVPKRQPCKALKHKLGLVRFNSKRNRQATLPSINSTFSSKGIPSKSPSSWLALRKALVRYLALPRPRPSLLASSLMNVSRLMSRKLVKPMTARRSTAINTRATIAPKSVLWRRMLRKSILTPLA